jgi:site-specific DNA-methyltransferase (adenine-specific)
MKPYYKDASVTIYHTDCREILATLSADTLVTDPPFNVGKNYGVSTDDLATDEYGALMGLLAACAFDRQAWIAPTNRLAMFARLLGDEAKPVVIRRGAQGPKRWGWYDQFDMVLVRGKPNEYVTNLWDNIRLKGEGYFFREETYGHPGYTPYAILARLTGILTPPGGTMIDPFCGTGTSLVAAKSLGLRAVGIEIEEEYCEVAARRLCQEVFDFDRQRPVAV